MKLEGSGSGGGDKKPESKSEMPKADVKKEDK
jgi:hypothetical protein